MRAPIPAASCVCTAILLMLAAACTDFEPFVEPQFSAGRSADGGLVVTMTAAPSSLRVGETAQLSALATNPGGRVVPAQLTWASSAPAIASVTADGVVSALAVGGTQITVSAARFSATFTLDVVPDAPYIDLVVTDVRPMVTELTRGQYMVVLVDFANIGTADAPEAMLHVEVLGADDAFITMQFASMGSLEAGSSGSLTISMPSDAIWPSTVRFVAIADAEHMIDESDETNNSATSHYIDILDADPPH